jgi:hypothetical protein
MLHKFFSWYYVFGPPSQRTTCLRPSALDSFTKNYLSPSLSSGLVHYELPVSVPQPLDSFTMNYLSPSLSLWTRSLRTTCLRPSASGLGH